MSTRLALGLSALIVAALIVVELIVPAGWRGRAELVAVAGLFVSAFLWRPQPALVVFAVFMLVHKTLAVWFAPDLRHVDELVVPILVGVSLWTRRPWRNGMIRPVRDGALLAMLGFGVVSALVNGVPLSIWLLALFLLAKVFGLLYVAAWHDWSVDDLRAGAVLVLGLAEVLITLGAVEAFDPHAFRAFFQLPDTGVARAGLPTLQSLFTSPTVFAWFTTFAALSAYAGYVVFRRWWLLLLGAGLSVGTLLAARRRAIAALGASLLAGFARSVPGSPRREVVRRWLPVGLAAGLVAIAFLPALVGLVDFTAGQSGPGGSDEARGALYRTSLAIGGDHFPLGVGLGRYGSTLAVADYSPVYREYGLDKVKGLRPDNPSAATDAFWARILGETGVAGLAAMLLFTILLSLELWRAAAARSRVQPLEAAFLLAAWMTFVQGLVETLVSSLYDSPPRAYLLLGTAGVALALARRARAAARSDTQFG